jgi:uncharacterized oligopeptide transporter (OPT) family protein
MNEPAAAASDASSSASSSSTTDPRRWAWLPPVGSWKYYALLGALGMLVLGPLGGVTASFMNFSIGFFVGGQVLAGILGSTVTYGYGPEGKHGANYMQTAAASVAGLGGMAVVVQGMVWMGLPQPPAWQLMLFMGSIAMFGAGVGMLYTPILVDRLQLTFPSGLAVANILRALSDPVLLKRSVSRLGGGTLAGLIGGVASFKIAALGVAELSMSTLGAGMVIGTRIAVPALVAAVLGYYLVPFFVSIGWLEKGDPARKITFLIGLGLVLGAAVLDVGLILKQAWARWRSASVQSLAGGAVAAEAELPAWQRMSMPRLILWCAFWGLMVVVVGTQVLHQPAVFLVFALALVLVFALVNGIALGISDSTPISSAFVVSVLLMALIGLKDPGVGMMAGSILLVSCSVAGDMQQDRSTGWRLGTPRVIQFRFQVAGLALGAVLSVGFAHIFMTTYPILKLDQTVLSAAQQPEHWQSAMTYKIVGALRSITDDKPHLRAAMLWGVGLGFAIQLARKLLLDREAWRRFATGSTRGRITDWLVDAVFLSSPYASSFGTFFNVPTSAWLVAGATVAEVSKALGPKEQDPNLPADMSTASLVGGGLIAGDALAALGLGLVGLATTLL